MKPKPRTLSSEPKLPPTPRKSKMFPSKFKFDPPPEAPVFLPTLEEFEDPLKYINKIRPIGQTTGICKIIPPQGWKVPFVLDKEQLKFTPRIQRINELEARTRIKLNFIDQLTKFFGLRGKTFQVPVIEKRTLDLYTLHKLVRDEGGHENVTKTKKWPDISQKMGFTTTKTPPLLRTHYDHLIYPFITSRTETETNNDSGDSEEKTEAGEANTPSLRELKSLTFLGPGPKMAVCDIKFAKSVKTRTRGKKIEYEFDPLAKYMCKSCSNGEIEESLVTCNSCEDRYHSSCLIPPLTDAITYFWKCPKCIATEACKSLEEFGFAQAEREYSLNEFKEMADKFKTVYFKTNPKAVPSSVVENEFWRIVSSIEESVTVEYGADLHVIDHGSGFPMKNKPTTVEIDQDVFNKYADSAWNLNNLPVLKASVLRHISADISGMKIPWMYAGMCFATFCWHNEDHWSYSINYLHMGEPKTWYGVPGNSAEDFERAMKQEAPELFDSQPDILHQLVTIMNPNDIMKTGVPMYRTDQKEGEFVITFPRAYHAGFNQGFNFAEACNFAPYDWLHIGRECINHYSSLKRYCVFSHDELVCKMAELYDELDKKILLATYKDMRTMMNNEHKKRRRLLVKGIRNASRVRFDECPDDERQCFVCKTTCFLSAIICKCTPSKLVCLDHYDQLCVCPCSNYKLKYHYKIDELVAILYVMRNKVEHFDKWIVSVNKTFADHNKKFYFRIFTELLIDSKDKEFTKSELLEVLENQVKNCLKISSTAKIFMKNVNGESLKPDKKQTVGELTKLSAQLNDFPCTITEANSIKNLLTIALKLQKIVKKLLNARVPNRQRIERALHLLKAVNLDFEELPALEMKLTECDWIEKCEDVLGSCCELEVIEKLLKTADQFVNSKPIAQKRKRIYAQLINLRAWKENVNRAINKHPFTELGHLREILSESEKLINVILPEKEKLATIVKTANEIDSDLQPLMNGETLLYYDDIVQVVEKARKVPVTFPNWVVFQDRMSDTNRWLTKLKKLFLRRSSPIDLMNCLWPRHFIPRSGFYNRPDGVSYCKLEGLLDDMKQLTEKDFSRSYKKQLSSLYELRLQNSSLKVEPLNMFCPCGKTLTGKLIECAICLCTYHSQCFIIENKNSHPTLYRYYSKLMCAFCLKTARPQLTEVQQLLTESKSLPMKVPECLVLEYTLTKINNWRSRAQQVLTSYEAVTALSDIRSNDEKLSKIQRFMNIDAILANTKEPPVHLEISLQRIIRGMKDFKHLGINPVLKSQLRMLMIEGDTLEVTLQEMNDIWMILEATEMTDYFTIDSFHIPLKCHAKKMSENQPIQASTTMPIHSNTQTNAAIPKLQNNTISVIQNVRSLVGQKVIEAVSPKASVNSTGARVIIQKVANPTVHTVTTSEDQNMTESESTTDIDKITQNTAQSKMTLNSNVGYVHSRKSIVKTKMKVVKKSGNPNMKRVLKQMKRLPNPGAYLTLPAKPKALTRVTSSAIDNPASPGASSVYSEHDEECAAENCLKPIEDSLDWVQCDGRCGQWFHMKCVDLTKQEISEDDEYICHHCLGEQISEEEEEVSMADLSRAECFAHSILPDTEYDVDIQSF